MTDIQGDFDLPALASRVLSAVSLLEDEGERAASIFDHSLLAGKTVLITGASGLIGTGLTAALRRLRGKSGNATIYAQTISEPPAHLQRWADEGLIRLLRCDLADPANWPSLPSADFILHAAGYGQPARFMADPYSPLMLNTGATGALLKKLKPDGTFMFFSSSEVLQGSEKSILRESDIGRTAPDHPRACYIEGKRGGEAFCHAARDLGARAIIVRLGHIYGPGTRSGDRRVMNMFIEKALVQNVIEMQDSGLAVRTWGYIRDTVEMSLSILFRGREAVYNVGGHDKCSIRELAQKIGNLCNVEVKLPQVDQSVRGSPMAVELDLSRGEREFGKGKYVSLEEGLSVTIGFQSSLYRQCGVLRK